MYVCPALFIPVLPLMPSLKLCEGSGTSPIRALDFLDEVGPSEVLPAYTPPVVGVIPTLLVPTLALESPVVVRRLHQVREGLWHMQRCRELFAAAVHGVDNLVYDPEGDRMSLRGEGVTESSSSEEGSGESEGDVE